MAIRHNHICFNF